MIFNDYLTVMAYGMCAGFAIGFTSWAVGFVIYSIIKLFKISAR